MIKLIIPLIFLSLSLLTSAQQPKVMPDLVLKDQHAFEALSKPERIKYLKLKKEAAGEFVKEKYFTCILKTIEAEKVFSQDYEIYFWRGLCYAQWNDVEGSIDMYQKVLRAYQDNITVAMNLFEVCYTSKQYANCILINNKLRSLYGKPHFPRHHVPLLEFKRLICLKKINEIQPKPSFDKEIKLLSALYTHNQDSPYAYYVDALNHYEKKEFELGDGRVDSAVYVFDEVHVVLWNKALSDMGYIQEFRFSRSLFYHDVDLENANK